MINLCMAGYNELKCVSFENLVSYILPLGTRLKDLDITGIILMSFNLYSFPHETRLENMFESDRRDLEGTVHITLGRGPSGLNPSLATYERLRPQRWIICQECSLLLPACKTL